MILEENNAVISKFVVGPLETNCYVIHERSSLKGLLIDPGVYDPDVVKYIRDNNIDVLYTLNTHGHADHIFGDSGFGYPVLIHELDEPYLRDGEKNLAGWLNEVMKPVKTERLLKDGDDVVVGSLIFEVMHTPGHTPGGISVKLDSFLFSGDTLFFEGVGRTDCPGGDHEALFRSINEKLMALPDFVRVFPGHGPETTIGHERKSNPFL
ncbi:MAG: MBL fold metallo-hydrolase [Candidatus Omnitrophota bacterium]